MPAWDRGARRLFSMPPGIFAAVVVAQCYGSSSSASARAGGVGDDGQTASVATASVTVTFPATPVPVNPLIMGAPPRIPSPNLPIPVMARRLFAVPAPLTRVHLASLCAACRLSLRQRL